MSTVRPTLAAALRETLARRTSFWIQVGIMVLNDVAWIGFWFLFFHRVGPVRGWDRSGILLLLAVLTTAGGTVLGLLDNVRNIPTMITDGRLDATLLLPVGPLRHLLVRSVRPVNIGDMGFGVVLFLVAGHPTPLRILVFLAGSACGAAVLAGFLVFAGSLTFFTGRREAGDLGFNAMLLLGAYPAEVFTGVTRSLLYVVVPAAFIASVPAQVVLHFDATRAATLVGAAIGFATLGWATFTIGLRRYTSGATWTDA